MVKEYEVGEVLALGEEGDTKFTIKCKFGLGDKTAYIASFADFDGGNVLLRPYDVEGNASGQLRFSFNDGTAVVTPFNDDFVPLYDANDRLAFLVTSEGNQVSIGESLTENVNLASVYWRTGDRTSAVFSIVPEADVDEDAGPLAEGTVSYVRGAKDVGYKIISVRDDEPIVVEVDGQKAVGVPDETGLKFKSVYNLNLEKRVGSGASLEAFEAVTANGENCVVTVSKPNEGALKDAKKAFSVHKYFERVGREEGEPLPCHAPPFEKIVVPSSNGGVARVFTPQPRLEPNLYSMFKGILSRIETVPISSSNILESTSSGRLQLSNPMSYVPPALAVEIVFNIAKLEERLAKLEDPVYLIDVKPDNVMWEVEVADILDQRARLERLLERALFGERRDVFCDFGAVVKESKLLKIELEGEERGSILHFTPRFMVPECVGPEGPKPTGLVEDSRVYMLGALLATLLTGRPPYEGVRVPDVPTSYLPRLIRERGSEEQIEQFRQAHAYRDIIRADTVGAYNFTRCLNKIKFPVNVRHRAFSDEKASMEKKVKELTKRLLASSMGKLNYAADGTTVQGINSLDQVTTLYSPPRLTFSAFIREMETIYDMRKTVVTLNGRSHTVWRQHRLEAPSLETLLARFDKLERLEKRALEAKATAEAAAKKSDNSPKPGGKKGKASRTPAS